jgi:hypothetical protein
MSIDTILYNRTLLDEIRDGIQPSPTTSSYTVFSSFNQTQLTSQSTNAPIQLFSLSGTFIQNKKYFFQIHFSCSAVSNNENMGSTLSFADGTNISSNYAVNIASSAKCLMCEYVPASTYTGSYTFSITGLGGNALSLTTSDYFSMLCTVLTP